jgi:thioredoxin reductase (NADPH)
MQVHLLVRSGKMRASAAMQDRVLNHEKVEVHFNTGVADAYGDKKGLKGLHLRDTTTGVPAFGRGSWCQAACLKDVPP